MLEIIIGRAGTGKTHTCLESMKKFLNQRGLAARIFLLMPAYMTYKTERQFAEMTNGQTNTYAYSFQRFARQILTETSGESIPKINEIGRRIILRKILLQRDKNQELKYFARAVKQRGFTETLSDSIKELRTYNIQPEALRQATYNLDDDELCDKLLDLAMLNEDFKEAIAGKNYDDADIIELAAAQIKNSQLCKDAEIYIDGFIFFDPLQRKIIRELLIHAANVHIVLPLDVKIDDVDKIDISSSENDVDIGLFRQSMKTFNILKKLASEIDIKIKLTGFDKLQRFNRGALKFLERNLFAFPMTKLSIDNETDAVKIIEASNQRVEAEAVAQDLLKIKAEKNYKFSDFGILIRDEHYERLLKPVFELHEIPYFSDKARTALHHPLAELIRSTLEVLTTRRPDAIFYCLRTGFFDITSTDIDLLENYVIEFGIKGIEKWRQTDSWTWHRREFDDDIDTISESEKNRLEQVDSIRRKVMNEFSTYFEKVSNKKNLSVREISEALFELLESLKVPYTLNKWSRKAANEGDLVLAREHLTIWNEVVNLFEQFVEIMGDEVIKIKEFAVLINEGIEAIQMSLIPQGLDEVTVANLEMNSLQNTKAIYILGCNEGAMPRSINETGLLSNADRYYLDKNAGIEIHAGQIESSLNEKFLLYRGFTEASAYLCLSYSLADGQGKSMRHSPLIENLISLIPKASREYPTIEILGTNSDLRFIVDEKKISTEVATKLFAPYRNTVKSSVSKIEKFMSCPFQHFAQYGLKLEERREHKFKAPDLGNLLHSVLRKFGERMQSENRRWSSVEPDELNKIVDEIFDEIIPRFLNKLLLSNKTYKYQLERIHNSAIRSLRRLIEFDSVSRFHPEKFEISFGFKDSDKSLSYDLDNEIKLELAGRIDRIDIDETKNYFLIMDYKTGNAYINLIDVYYGLSLQLLTYLLVAKDHLIDKLPAGMLYCFLKYQPKSEKSRKTEAEAHKIIENSLKMPGWVLADKKVIKDIDSSLNFIKIQFTNDGEFFKNSLPYIKTADEFKLLLNYVAKTLQSAGNRIIGGDIAAKPYKNDKGNKKTCDLCPFSAVCGFDPSIKNNDWKKAADLNDKQIFELIEKETNS